MDETQLLSVGMGLLLGALLGSLTWISLTRGRVWLKTGTYHRHTSPIMYWLGTSVYAVGALACLVWAGVSLWL